MRRRAISFSITAMIGFAAGLMLTLPCQSETTDAALKNVLKQYLKDQGVENDGKVRYSVAFIDLNDDGVKEVLVHIMCQSLCGTGGCPTLVLVPTNSSFKIMTRISITRPPIRVLDKKSNGWHELAVWVQGGGIQPGYEAELPFDGESYASNPTVPPAHRLTGNGKGRRAISSVGTGMPLD